jgi:DNA-binding transcriptional regulator YiaG
MWPLSALNPFWTEIIHTLANEKKQVQGVKVNGTELKLMRISRHLTQTQICKRIKAQQRQYSDWENDKASPSLEQYKRLLRVLTRTPK